MTQSARINLSIHSWVSYFHGGREGKWVGQASAKNRLIRLRRGIRWLRNVPVLRRIPIRIAGHEVRHLVKADFASNADHHDDPRWVQADPENRKLHECGLSYSIKADDVKAGTPWFRRQWAKRRWFSLKHIGDDCVALGKTLLRDGVVDLPYEAGSALWLDVNKR